VKGREFQQLFPLAAFLEIGGKFKNNGPRAPQKITVKIQIPKSRPSPVTLTTQKTN
jgi:hypothetical protein